MAAYSKRSCLLSPFHSQPQPLTVMSVMSWAVVVGHVLVLVEEDAHDLGLLLLLDGAVDVELLHDAVHHLRHVGRLQVQDEDA